MAYNCVPGGYETENSDDDLFADGFYTEKKKFAPKIIEKSPIELKKEKLFDFLKKNEVDEIRDELDKGAVKGFDIDEPIDGSWNLLYHACYLALPDIVQFLIDERGACINTTTNDETPLMVACYSEGETENVLKVVKALIKESTIVSSSNLFGVTPLMFASRHGHASVVSFLLSLNDAYDAIDNEGKNALFHAIDGKHVEIAKMLIAAGIDLSVAHKFGSTAKDYARDELQQDIFELFPAEIQRFQIPCNYLSYNRFEDLIPGIAEM